jgi:hypothetical protein
VSVNGYIEFAFPNSNLLLSCDFIVKHRQINQAFMDLCITRDHKAPTGFKLIDIDSKFIMRFGMSCYCKHVLRLC